MKRTTARRPVYQPQLGDLVSWKSRHHHRVIQGMVVNLNPEASSTLGAGTITVYTHEGYIPGTDQPLSCLVPASYLTLVARPPAADALTVVEMEAEHYRNYYRTNYPNHPAGAPNYPVFH
jgi:hypothetical protein